MRMLSTQYLNKYHSGLAMVINQWGKMHSKQNIDESNSKNSRLGASFSNTRQKGPNEKLNLVLFCPLFLSFN